MLGKEWKETRPIPNAIHLHELLLDVSASSADSITLTQWLAFCCCYELESCYIARAPLNWKCSCYRVLVCWDYRNAPYALQGLFFVPITNLPFGSTPP